MKLRCKKLFILGFCLITLFSVTYMCTTILCKDINITKQFDCSYSNKTTLRTGVKNFTVLKYQYNPNKYVIGIHGEYVAVFKTDAEGKFVLESPKDISNVSISKLTDVDIDMLKTGDNIYQYDTKEEAEEALRAMFIS